MPDYILPRVQVEQEFTQIPVFTNQPLAALIIGPQYKLCRYAVEKADTIVTNPSDSTLGNAYQSGVDTTYVYPSKAGTSVVDQSYNKVFLDQVEAQYFPNSTLGSASATVTKVQIPGSSPTAYFANRLHASIVFKTANGSNRNAVFSNRDVAVGDIVALTDGSFSMKSKVKAFYAEAIAASIGSPTNDSGNKATVTNQVNALAQSAGSAPANTTVALGATTYYGYPELGIMSDTYTLEVTSGGLYAAVRFKLSSANGAFAPRTGVAFTSVNGGTGVGTFTAETTTRGSITVTFTPAGGFENTVTLTVGQKWTFNTRAAVSQVTPATTGTYTGAKDLTYKLTIVRGGNFLTSSDVNTCARAQITSTDTDSSATVNIDTNTFFTVGSYAVQAKFATAPGTNGSGGAFILGDIYYVPVTAAKDGAIQTIEMQDSITSDLVASVGTLTITLALPQAHITVPSIRSLIGSTFNWTSTANDITVKAGITTTDSTLVVGSDAVALAITAAKVFVERRDLIKDNVTSIGSVSSLGAVATLLGVVDPDNTLAQGVYDAVLNSADTIVYYVGISSNDLTGYVAALELAKKSESYYSLVPLTFDRTIQDAIISHINAQSTSKNAKWRIAWLSCPLVPQALIYNLKPDNSNWLGTVTDNPTVAGTQYTLVTIAGATLLTDGVRVGDSLLINFRLDPTNTTIWDTYTVSEVRTETSLVISTAVPSAINVGIKVQIQRTYTKDEQITNLAGVGGGFNNRRVNTVFPDTYKAGSVTKNGYFLAASLAGLASGTVPHQGLTNIEILGPTDLSKAVTDFTEDQLNVLASAGIWIVTQNIVGATAYTRHQLTTDTSGLNFAESSITRNVDSITKGLNTALKPYIGIYNNNPATVLKVRSVIDDELKFRLLNTITERAGAQLNGYQILSVAADTTFKDRINAKVQLDVPSPTNNVVVELLV